MLVLTSMGCEQGLLLLQSLIDVVEAEVVFGHQFVHASVFKALHQRQDIGQGLVDAVADGFKTGSGFWHKL